MEKGEESLLSNIEAHLFSNPSLALISISPNATSSWKETEKKILPCLAVFCLLQLCYVHNTSINLSLHFSILILRQDPKIPKNKLSPFCLTYLCENRADRTLLEKKKIMQFTLQVTLFPGKYSQSVFHKKWPSWIRNWHFLCLSRGYILNSSVLNQNGMGIVTCTGMKFVLAFSIVHMFTSGWFFLFLHCRILGRYSNISSSIVNQSNPIKEELKGDLGCTNLQKTLGLSLPIRMGWRLNELGNNSYKYAYELLAWSRKAFLLSKLKMGLNFRHKLKMKIMINCIDISKICFFSIMLPLPGELMLRTVGTEGFL